MHEYTARFRRGTSVHDYSYTVTKFAARDFRQVTDLAERFAQRRGTVLVSLTLKED